MPPLAARASRTRAAEKDEEGSRGRLECRNEKRIEEKGTERKEAK